MAENDRDQERTEQATPKRKEEARRKGQTAKSREIPSVAVLGISLILLYFYGSGMTEQLMDLMVSAFRLSGDTLVDRGNFSRILTDFAFRGFSMMFLFFVSVLAAGILANVLQVGFMITTEAVAPKFSKLDPIKGLGRLFSLQALVEFLKSLLKLGIVGTAAWLMVHRELGGIFPLVRQSAGQIFVYIAGVSFRIMLVTTLVLVLLALLDYMYQRWEYEKSLRMTRQEVKEEFKQTEGDPLIKSRIRRLQREIARRRMMAAVPKADVIITNPDHLAVAVRYDPRGFAPVVIAKGAGFIAEKIKDLGRRHGIPLVENKPVAQLLYKTVNVNQYIPETLYRAVAEILAYVYSLKQRNPFGV
ncbi:MAG TPA: flagellar biosynthesis protein FlhB [Syntrophales bacterium]|nr:flagellar biosynthesis protein FlhB [Syntrophales bacterium]HPX10987.1 flagellar biosynthesis protein FlhB [Syntrophales bacterium]HQB30873.1 flagellar biosynthesis protein FlhB [Syntrophales bacterium]HQN77662.1 flagellar biosynthesis protein FlhB [Syntrophales bacterium]HQQ26586.1 flagellar biosynthesis protein FlhB [Syntrophales bacterium]